MGYKSQVAIAIKSEVFMEAPEEVKAAFKDIFVQPLSHEGGMILFESSGVNWFERVPGFESVTAIDDWLYETVEAHEFGFIRIGENVDDIDCIGCPADFGLGVRRTITHPKLTEEL